MRSLIKIKRISNNHLRTDKDYLLDVDFEEIFKLRKSDKYYFIHEYYKLKICKLIYQMNNFSQVDLKNLNNIPFKLNRHSFCLICLYNRSYVQIVNYIETMLNDEKEINSNSLINLRVDLKHGKYFLLLKTFYFFLEKFFKLKNYGTISNLRLNVDKILSLLDDNKTILNDNILYVQQIRYYLGISYFKTDQFEKSEEYFKYLMDNYEIIEMKNIVVFFRKMIEKINLKKNFNKNKNFSNEINKLIKELIDLKN